ncbi:MAG: IS1595 family transposase [bacterium]|nr:IS1595 family transposase [bacterium]
MARPSFPRTFREFQDWFSTEEACRRFLIESRWPEGFSCPRCGCSRGYGITRGSLLECRGCSYQVSATAGTVMHRTRTPLRDWFCAAYLVTTHTPGFSALQLQRQLGLKRYETAWVMLHKLRRAMIRPERDRIAAPVEVDEAYVGGREEGRKGGRHGDGTKAIVVAAVEIRGRASGRIRLAMLEDVSAASLVGFIKSAVEPGSQVFTDGWQGYSPLRKEGYDHRPKTQGPGKNASSHLPRVHRVFSNLKNWLKGTHHGVSRKHLPHYLNEYVFRFNRRRTPMAAFQSLLGLTGQHEPTTYKMLYAPESTG